MFRRHVRRYLSAYLHRELRPEEIARVQLHLQNCASCRAAYEEIQWGVQLAAGLKISSAPDAIWEELSNRSLPHVSRRGGPAVAIVAIAMMAVFVVIIWKRSSQTPGWEVSGLPGIAHLRPGEVLQTGSNSNVQVQIADIGQLDVRPNSRIRLLVNRSNEHRIALDHGSVEAQTWAPPRLFIVDTPSASAVDLGCKYTLDVQDDGSSLLHVTAGLVALDRGGRETIVPAGAFCRTRRGAGSGTPFFEDASTEFQEALQKVDALGQSPGRNQALKTVLREARVRDALSLWHLLPSLEEESRGLVYDRLAELLPPPAGVTRDGVVRLDEKMLRSWEKVVSQLWQ